MLLSVPEDFEVPDIPRESSGKQTSELNRIVFSFHQLIERLEKNNQALESRAGQLRSLGEVMEFNPARPHSNRLLKLGLQKACEGIGAGRGPKLGGAGRWAYLRVPFRGRCALERWPAGDGAGLRVLPVLDCR